MGSESSNGSTPERSPARIVASVYLALFLREALTRISSSRAAWFWLLAEPIFNVSYMLFIYTVVQVRTVGGIDTVIWLMVGMVAFFMFTRTSAQVSAAISSNLALFTYRQVKPIDTLLVRGGLEGVLMIVIAGVLLAGAALFGHSVIPVDPLVVLEALLGLWLVGMGFGLVDSIATELVPELGRIIGFVMMPLYFISGVVLPISAVPQPYRDWLMLNPVAQGVEAARFGFSSNYHPASELDIAYLYEFALVSIFLGLALHRRFALRLATQ